MTEKKKNHLINQSANSCFKRKLKSFLSMLIFTAVYISQLKVLRDFSSTKVSLCDDPVMIIIVILHASGFLLTSAAGRCPWPGAISLAESDAGSLEVKTGLASHTTGRVKVVVTYILDKEAIIWGQQCWTMYHWGEERRGAGEFYITANTQTDTLWQKVDFVDKNWIKKQVSRKLQHINLQHSIFSSCLRK